MNASTFTELWQAWGPLLATVFGGLSFAIVMLVRAYREREAEIRQLRDAQVANAVAERDCYAALLMRVLEATTKHTEAVDGLRESLRLEDQIAGMDAHITDALRYIQPGGGSGEGQ